MNISTREVGLKDAMNVEVTIDGPFKHSKFTFECLEQANAFIVALTFKFYGIE